ncbi:MAG: hypothetical protein ACRDMZ_03230, partial [Solirubrobacteraceae bacterium]
LREGELARRGPSMSVGSRRWYDGLPDVTAELLCGGHRHEISWRRGKVVLEDHDLLAERSLVALGSEPPLCVEVLDAWRRLRGSGLLEELLDGDAVPIEELASRGLLHAEAVRRGTDLIAGPGQILRGLLASTQRNIELERRAWASTLLRALPAEFRRRLALAVLVELARHWHDEAFRNAHREHVESALTATAGALVQRSARCRIPDLKWYARVAIVARVLAPGEPPRCSVRLDATGGAGTVSLPLGWFTDVWSRGLALVDGCFVTRCVGADAGAEALPVVAIRWERDGRDGARSVDVPAIVTRGDDGAWALRWV